MLFPLVLLWTTLANVQFKAPSTLCCGWGYSNEQTVLSSDELEGESVNFGILVRQQQATRAQQIAVEVSDPHHAAYGKHLTADQLDELTAPTPDDFWRVRTWLATELKDEQLTIVRQRWIKVSCRASVAGRLFSADFNRISRKAANGRTQTRLIATTYSLPLEVKEAITAVYGLQGVPVPHPTPTQPLEVPLYGPPPVAIKDLKQLYNISDPPATLSPTNKQAVVGFLHQTFSLSDLKVFFKEFVSNTTVPSVKCGGGTGADLCEGTAETEASMDIQYLMGLAPGINTEYWLFNGDTLDFCGTVLDWTQATLGSAHPPLVNSVSYGFQGDLSQAGCTPAHQHAVESDLAALAARGITALLASGDQGNAQSDEDGKNYPSWPASSPWVTAVGATEFDNFKMWAEEVAPSFMFASGGGFSFDFPRSNASYQQAAVNAYINSGVRMPPTGKWATNGRATPDVSALGEGYQVLQNGRAKADGSGTSAATPTFAAIVTLLNEQRLQRNMSAMGFLNPFLYQNAGAFTDVTIGYSSQNGKRDLNAYACTRGWDPVTGLGTPVYPRLLQAALKAGDA